MITITILLCFIALVIAMLCRSLVHTLLHHYPAFYLKFGDEFKIDNKWWDPSISWKQKYVTDENFELVLKDMEPIRNKKLVQFSDAFHTFNTVELGAYNFIISLLLCLWLGLAWWWSIIIFLIVGIVIMPLVFTIGYDKLWR